ncbi:MAG: RimK family alpha-L-glutamate ligase [Oscillospiraceae bacterium]
MKGWLLTGGKFDQSAQRLLDTVDMGEHKFEIINCSDVAYSIDYHLPAKIWVNEQETTPPDFFMIADSEGGFVFPFAKHLERLGILNFNPVEAKHIAMSKIATYQVLAKEGLPIVKTLVFHKNMSQKTLIKEIGLPMVIKPDDGFGGEGVELIMTEEELEKVLERIKKSDALMLVQEYVSTSKGRDVRVITIGHEAVFAACRTAGNQDEFRSNLKVGGSAEEYPLTDEIKELCHKVSKAIGLNMSGIDLLFLEDGFVVGEVNSSAGFDSWLGKKDLASVFLKSVGKELLRHPVPHWQLLKLFEAAKTKQLSEVLLSLDDLAFYKGVHGLYENCAKTQELVLLEMLDAAKDTEFGKKHRFASIKTVDEFCKQMPLTDWDDYEADVRKLEEGQSDILFPGKAVFFYRTSGTTSGFKYVPESQRESTARSAISKARNAENFMLFSKNVAKRIFVFANKSSIDKSVGGILRGTASGRTGEMVNPQLKESIAYPLDLANYFDGEQLIYMMLRCSLIHSDMSAVLGNNALMFRKIIDFGIENARLLTEHIREGVCAYEVPEHLKNELNHLFQPNPKRAAELEMLIEKQQFIPKYYWPDLKVAGFWLGGSVGQYVHEVRDYLSETVKFMDVGYGASETKMNIPLKPGTPAGALSIFSGFFEFIPQGGQEILRAHELKDGETYEIVITTYAGLYRYRLKDLIKVEGFTGDTPNIYFVTKLSDVASIGQEKIAGSHLSDCIHQILKEHDIYLKCVQVYPNHAEQRYVVCIEAQGKQQQLEQMIEQGLCAKLAQYKIYRDKLLKPLRVVVMKEGFGEMLIKQYTKENATAAQVKIPVVISDMPDKSWQK